MIAYEAAVFNSLLASDENAVAMRRGSCYNRNGVWIHMLRKNDGILIATVIILAAALMLIQRLRSGEGEYVRITVDGAVYGEYPLSEDQIIEVCGAWGYNQVVISAGAVSVAEADCPDRYCVAHTPASGSGQTIICLPHKMTVTVLGREAAPEIDAVSQ